MAIVLNGATSGNVTIDANAISGTSIITLPVGSGTFPLMTLSTAVATTSGTAIDFTSIPSWVKKITVMFNGVSTNGTSNFLFQIGSGSVETTGYLGHVIAIQSAATSSGGNTSTSGLPLTVSIIGATDLYNGHIILTHLGSNLWISSHNLGNTAGSRQNVGGGTKTTSSTLDRVRITTTNGTDTFDAGSVNILMEGY